MFSDIGTSSFMSEMRETAYLLQHITNTSIVIIDELGRSTSPSDALGITGAVCEDLIRTRVRYSSWRTYCKICKREKITY